MDSNQNPYSSTLQPVDVDATEGRANRFDKLGLVAFCLAIAEPTLLWLQLTLWLNRPRSTGGPQGSQPYLIDAALYWCLVLLPLLIVVLSIGSVWQWNRRLRFRVLGALGLCAGTIYTLVLGYFVFT